MTDSATLLETAGLGDTLGTLFFLVVFFIAPVIKQVLNERKKQARLDESRHKREERTGQPSSDRPFPGEAETEPIPPFPWEMVEEVSEPVFVPPPVAVPRPTQAKSRSVFEEWTGLELEQHVELAEADWAPLELQQKDPQPISLRAARRQLERRRPVRPKRRDWRAAVVTAELLAPPVALRGPGSEPGPGLGAPTGLG